MNISFFGNNNTSQAHTGKQLIVNPANPSSEDRNRQEAIEEGVQFKSLQAAYNVAQGGDTIRLISDTTEDIVLPIFSQGVSLILVNCQINGSISTPTANFIVRGTIEGLGNARITGNVSVSGRSQFSRIEKVRIDGKIINASLIRESTLTGFGLTIRTGFGASPILENCVLSNQNTLFATYAFPGGTFKNCQINCNNFSTRVGGMSPGGGTYRFENTKINCQNNGFAWRGTANIHFINSVLETKGTDYFMYGDAGGTANAYVENSKLITERNRIYNTPTNYTHINLQRNKPIGTGGNQIYVNNDQERTNIIT